MWKFSSFLQKSTAINREEDYMSLNNIKTKFTAKRILIGLSIFLFALFLFNVFRTNSQAKVEDSTIEENLSFIKKYNFSNVADMEKKIDETGGTNNTARKSTGISKLKYKSIFDGCIVIGDSITEGLSAYDFLNEDQVYHKIGASIMKNSDMIDKAAKAYPKAAFFTFGMNDMGNYNGNAQAFTKKYKTCIKNFMKTSPDTKVFVNSISTPSQSARSKNSSLKNYKEFNAEIRRMCQALDITFIENNYILDEHPEYYAKDGIHVSPSYYPIWLNNMILKAGL